MISVICIYNDKAQLERYLLRGLKQQDVAFDLITIDNTLGQHTSAPPVLNATGCSARGDFLMFVHQDVELLSPSWLRDAEQTVARLPDLGAAGVAGRTAHGKMVASVWHGEPATRADKRKPKKKPLKTQTLDGCLAITPAAVFKQVRFDEDVCRGWHLFIAEYCLTLGSKGFGVYVLPCEVYHRSTGPADKRVYAQTVEAIIKKHGPYHRFIHTTVGTWPEPKQPVSLTSKIRSSIRTWFSPGKSPR